MSNGIIAYAGTAGIEIANDQLVIHLRAGDTQNLSQDYYATNPLFYYHWLRTFLQHAIIVTEPGPPHQLLDEIKAVFATSMVVSGSVREDFERLRQAQHLASSGAGTFAPAAAMLSTRLKTFYCSDIYLDEHLNPDMLNRGIVMVKMLKLPGYKRAWDQSKIRQDLIRTYHPYRN